METTNALINQFNESIACRKVLESNNSILLIQPYYQGGFWAFDDARTGLTAEPFVAGADDLIEYQLGKLGILEEARRGFTAIFSTLPFPGHHTRLQFHSFQNMGSVYTVPDEPGFWNSAGRNEVWLCPALNLYFKDSPRELFVQFKRNTDLPSN